MHHSPKHHILIFLLITVLCLGGLGLVFVSKDTSIARSGERVEKTREVIMHTQAARSTIYNMLSLQRGYLLSREKTLLDDYDASKAQMDNYFSLLSGLTKGNVSQENRIEELKRHYAEFSGKLDSMLESYVREKNLGSLQDLQQVNEIRDSIDNVASQILNEEYKLLNDYLAYLNKAKIDLYSFLGIGVLLSALILTVLNSYMLWLQGRRVQVEESLKETEERLRLAIRGTNDGVYDWDIQSKKMYWSPQFKNMLGYEADGLEASRDMLDALIHPADREQAWNTIESYLNGELSELAIVTRIRHKTGRWLWINMRGKAIFDANGKAIRLTGTYTDISHLKEYEARLEEAKNQAEKANQAKTEFLAHMSHEIRTPLTSISGVAEILAAQSQDFSQKQQQLVKVLSYSTMTLKELINDILDFSKIESGQLELEKKPFSLHDLFQEINNTMSVRSQEKGLVFNTSYIDIGDTSFVGDKVRVRQILMNLVGNAIKFTHKGSVKLSACRDVYNGIPVLKIDVEDTGIGIEKSNFDLIFERFRQADTSVSRKYGGTGLGLSISKSLVESMGGWLELESVVGQGSRFTVLLPYDSSDSDFENIPSCEPEEKRIRPALGKKHRILLVEDYEGNIVVLSYILEALQCEFDIARTGTEALEIWKKNRPDLILMDVQMPEMDGLTATRHIRRMEAERGLSPIPIIGMTAHAFVEDKNKCTEAGMDSYLPKPIEENILSAEIVKYLKKTETRLERQVSGTEG